MASRRLILGQSGVVVAANMAIFVGVNSLPAFQELHHHWIFPVLAVILAVERIFSGLLPETRRGLLPGRAAARSTILSLSAFLIVMGIVRHESILTCFDGCGEKLALACAVVGGILLSQERSGRGGFWDTLRCRMGAAACWIWGPYLALRGQGITPWILELVFSIGALLLWLGRRRPVPLICALGIFAAGALRSTAHPPTIILGNLAWIAALLFGGAHKIEAYLARSAAHRIVRSGGDAPLYQRVLMSAGRIALTVAVISGLAVYAVGPIFFVTDTAKRRALLSSFAPPGGVDPARLSESAKRQRETVVFLARTIGERAAHQPAEQARARDYLAARFKELGLSVQVQSYESKWMGPFKNGTLFHNVEAVLPGRLRDEEGVIVLGAHYDTTAGTTGADDNASGVAVMLETARILKAAKPERSIRFVAFGTEEPPAFGTQNMGSHQYARRLKDLKIPVHLMISLEMLGYYNPRPGAQLYPPFMHLFYPKHGDFLTAVANFDSRGKLREFLKTWRGNSKMPMKGAVLPSALSSLALSDQLNFWSEGFPALMISDTAFYRNPHYHQESDSPETLDYEKMAEAARALAAGLD